MAIKSLFPQEMLNSSSGEMTLENIAGKLTYFHEQLHLIHWQTSSYAEHQAVGALYDYVHDFKNELSIKSGINVNDLTFPNIDPVPLTIFIEKSNMDSIKTIPHNDEWELKIHTTSGMSPDFEFQSKYPTYTSFIKDYKAEKLKINERYGQLLEDNRNLIESVYHDDMITYGYA